MCGIVAYVGSKSCSTLLLDGLKRLEYRGYDSAGVAIHLNPAAIELKDKSTKTGEKLESSLHKINVVRAVGKLSNLEAKLRSTNLSGCTGIGHTRWATHGKPNHMNAHPHVAGHIVVVHNGIIENHVALRAELKAQGISFSSDTDTETVAQLIYLASKNTPDFSSAVKEALGRVKGAYAIAVLSEDDPDRIVVAKQDSPLVLGIGDGEMFAASDIPAILAHTREVVPLEDGEIAVLCKDKYTLSKLDGTAVTRKAKHIDWTLTQAEKGGYKHFMLKEIFEQPRAIEDTLRGRADLENAGVIASEIGIDPEFSKRIRRVYFVACGTSAHAAMTARYWIESLAKLPATVEIASEVRHREPIFFDTDLVIAVSQSGETLDTLAAVKTAKTSGAKVLAIVNVMDSAISRISDSVFYTHAGPEIGVASTKCFTTQLAAMLLLALYLGEQRQTLSVEASRRILAALWHVPSLMREVLGLENEIRRIAKKHWRASDMLFLGRGLNYPVALEGALKLKEVSYLHAEGYAAGEMKHGPIALIDEHMPVVFVCPKDTYYDKTLSNMHEVRAREGQVIALGTRGDEELNTLKKNESGFELVELPHCEPEVLPLLTVLPLQLLSYFIADLKGTDVDQPRNLAKTVTVE